MKLTEYQITVIDASLKKTGIIYTDIRVEMTDHIASELEDIEGDFNTNLENYIAAHKKKLRRQNTKLVVLAWVKSWKAMGLNILKVRFLVTFFAVYCVAAGVNMLMDRYSIIMTLFMVFCVANSSVSLPSVVSILKKKDQYSIGEGVGILNLFVIFPGIIALKFVWDFSSDVFVLLYFTILISISLTLGYTVRMFKAQIKLKYHG